MRQPEDAARAVPTPTEDHSGDDALVRVELTLRDAALAVAHLRFLASRERAVDARHAAANLSTRYVADLIDAALRGPRPGEGQAL